MTKTEISALASKDLVALYNRLAGKSIKKFSSRAAGERQVASLLASAPKARIVRGAATSGKNGRPKITFTVRLTEAKAQSKPHPASDRMQLIEWLRKRPEGQASIDTIDSHFGKSMRGVVQKLFEKSWLVRVAE